MLDHIAWQDEFAHGVASSLRVASQSAIVSEGPEMEVLTVRYVDSYFVSGVTPRQNLTYGMGAPRDRAPLWPALHTQRPA